VDIRKSSKRSPTVVIVTIVMLTIVMLAASGRASAAPAVVKVFEATARQTPSGDAPSAQVFQEGAEISVSEEVTGGWRRVRLAGGKTAFVRDDEVRLVGPEYGPIQPLTGTRPPVQPLASVQPAASTPGSTLYVKDLDHLADLVKEDSLVHPRAESLATRRFAGYGVMFGGAALGGVLTIGGMTFLAGKDCSAGVCVTEMNKTAIYGGAALALVSAAVGFLISPSRSDLLDVVNEWNGRHADRQFAIDYRPRHGY
jgi:hypothetical protein